MHSDKPDGKRKWRKPNSMVNHSMKNKVFKFWLRYGKMIVKINSQFTIIRVRKLNREKAAYRRSDCEMRSYINEKMKQFLSRNLYNNIPRFIIERRNFSSRKIAKGRKGNY
jgi:hypothetical protein